MNRLILCAGAALLLAACGSNSETVTIPDGEGGTATIRADDKKAVITDAKGKTTTFDNSTAEFADFAPKYPGSTIKDSATITHEGQKTSTVNFNTGDSAQKVGEFYKASLEAKGMKPSVMTVDGQVMINAGSEDLPSALIVAGPAEEGGGTDVSLITNSKQ